MSQISAHTGKELSPPEHGFSNENFFLDHNSDLRKIWVNGVEMNRTCLESRPVLWDHAVCFSYNYAVFFNKFY